MRTRSAVRLFNMLVALVRRDKTDFIARLQRNVESLPNGCVVWKGAKSGGKYGDSYPRINLRLNGKCIPARAHRVFLTLMLGRPIAPYMEAGHVPPCRNTACIRHLEEQTKKHNLSLRTYGGRAEETTDTPF